MPGHTCSFLAPATTKEEIAARGCKDDPQAEELSARLSRLVHAEVLTSFGTAGCFSQQTAGKAVKACSGLDAGYA